MSLDAWELDCNEPQVKAHLVRFVGGTAAVTKANAGKGVTIAYVSTGLVDLTFSDNPGLFVGFSCEFQATTQSAVKGYTGVIGVISTTSPWVIRLAITGASEALVDLAALQWANLVLFFKGTSV